MRKGCVVGFACRHRIMMIATGGNELTSELTSEHRAVYLSIACAPDCDLFVDPGCFQLDCLHRRGWRALAQVLFQEM